MNYLTDQYQQELLKEKEYLKYTLNLIQDELEKETHSLSNRKEELLETRKEMWDNTAHSSEDFEKLTEMNQYLSLLTNQTASYERAYKQKEKYEKMLVSPYFGRFDFVEEEFGEKEKIYIGLHHMMDSKTLDIIVYDWRSPIASIFYQYELGNASYKAPMGEIKGEVLLKRQYKIQKGELKYFFDCSIKINDEILQQALSGHSSTKMKHIVQTIQKEQDAIIRDTENSVLIVQGVAGSGKTSIALHRIAFLLYHSINEKLTSSNILIISPNTVFSKYIANVLPELGEENVAEITFDDLVDQIISHNIQTQKRFSQLEKMISHQDSTEAQIKKASIDFKESKTFIEILNRLIQYYERKEIQFEDIYYEGVVVETKDMIRNQFLQDKIGMPIARRLKRIEGMILDKIQPLEKQRVRKIEKIVERRGQYPFEIEPYSRLLASKKSKVFLKKIRLFTEINYIDVYYRLFAKRDLLFNLAEGLDLPKNIEEIIEMTKKNLDSGYVPYEDCTPLMFLKLKLEGSDFFPQIKQVVVDEAQDYSPLHYEVFNMLFPTAKFTILGDVSQSIEKEVNTSLYDEVIQILDRPQSIQLRLDKSYRSSYEISSFAKKVLNLENDFISFERYEENPLVIKKEKLSQINEAIIKATKDLTHKGQESIAILCKTAKEAKEVYHQLKDHMKVKLIHSEENEIEKGIIIMPVYMAKGLEFDAVLVYNTSAERYRTSLDQKLLYIACTRALHYLALYHIEEKSRFIPHNGR